MATVFSTGLYGAATILDSKDQEAQGGFVKNAILVGIDFGLKLATKGVSSRIFKPAVEGVDDLAGIAYKNNKPYVKAGYEGVASWFGSKPGQYISKRELQAYLEYQRELSQMATEITRQEFSRGIEALKNVTMVGVDEWMKYRFNEVQIPGLDTNKRYNYNNGNKSYNYFLEYNKYSQFYWTNWSSVR